MDGLFGSLHLRIKEPLAFTQCKPANLFPAANSDGSVMSISMMNYRWLAGTLLFCFMSLVVSVATQPPARSQQGASNILGLHLVHKEQTAETARTSGIPDGYMIAPSGDATTGEYLIETKPMLTNSDFAEVSASFDQYTLSPTIRFRLKPAGASAFSQITAANIGRAFAIVVDGKVVSAPIIQTEIAGGEGVISGGFSVEEAQNLVERMKPGTED